MAGFEMDLTINCNVKGAEELIGKLETAKKEIDNISATAAKSGESIDKFKTERYDAAREAYDTAIRELKHLVAPENRGQDGTMYYRNTAASDTAGNIDKDVLASIMSRSNVAKEAIDDISSVERYATSFNKLGETIQKNFENILGDIRGKVTSVFSEAAKSMSTFDGATKQAARDMGLRHEVASSLTNRGLTYNPGDIDNIINTAVQRSASMFNTPEYFKKVGYDASSLHAYEKAFRLQDAFTSNYAKQEIKNMGEVHPKDTIRYIYRTPDELKADAGSTTHIGDSRFKDDAFKKILSIITTNGHVAGVVDGSSIGFRETTGRNAGLLKINRDMTYSDIYGEGGLRHKLMLAAQEEIERNMGADFLIGMGKPAPYRANGHLVKPNMFTTEANESDLNRIARRAMSSPYINAINKLDELRESILIPDESRTVNLLTRKTFKENNGIGSTVVLDGRSKMYEESSVPKNAYLAQKIFPFAEIEDKFGSSGTLLSRIEKAFNDYSYKGEHGFKEEIYRFEESAFTRLMNRAREANGLDAFSFNAPMRAENGNQIIRTISLKGYTEDRDSETIKKLISSGGMPGYVFAGMHGYGDEGYLRFIESGTAEMINKYAEQQQREAYRTMGYKDKDITDIMLSAAKSAATSGINFDDIESAAEHAGKNIREARSKAFDAQNKTYTPSSELFRLDKSILTDKNKMFILTDRQASESTLKDFSSQTYRTKTGKPISLEDGMMYLSTSLGSTNGASFQIRGMHDAKGSAVMMNDVVGAERAAGITKMKIVGSNDFDITDKEILGRIDKSVIKNIDPFLESLKDDKGNYIVGAEQRISDYIKAQIYGDGISFARNYANAKESDNIGSQLGRQILPDIAGSFIQSRILTDKYNEMKRGNADVIYETLYANSKHPNAALFAKNNPDRDKAFMDAGVQRDIENYYASGLSSIQRGERPLFDINTRGGYAQINAATNSTISAFQEDRSWENGTIKEGSDLYKRIGSFIDWAFGTNGREAGLTSKEIKELGISADRSGNTNKIIGSLLANEGLLDAQGNKIADTFFSSKGGLFATAYRNPGQFGEFVSAVNTYGLLGKFFESIGDSTAGAMFNPSQLAQMAGADFDGDMFKLIGIRGLDIKSLMSDLNLDYTNRISRLKFGSLFTSLNEDETNFKFKDVYGETLRKRIEGMEDAKSKGGLSEESIKQLEAYKEIASGSSDTLSALRTYTSIVKAISSMKNDGSFQADVNSFQSKNTSNIPTEKNEREDDFLAYLNRMMNAIPGMGSSSNIAAKFSGGFITQALNGQVYADSVRKGIQGNILYDIYSTVGKKEGKGDTSLVFQQAKAGNTFSKYIDLINNSKLKRLGENDYGEIIYGRDGVDINDVNNIRVKKEDIDKRLITIGDGKEAFDLRYFRNGASLSAGKNSFGLDSLAFLNTSSYTASDIQPLIGAFQSYSTSEGASYAKEAVEKIIEAQNKTIDTSELFQSNLKENKELGIFNESEEGIIKEFAKQRGRFLAETGFGIRPGYTEQEINSGIVQAAVIDKIVEAAAKRQLYRVRGNSGEEVYTYKHDGKSEIITKGERDNLIENGVNEDRFTKWGLNQIKNEIGKQIGLEAFKTSLGTNGQIGSLGTSLEEQLRFMKLQKSFIDTGSNDSVKKDYETLISRLEDYKNNQSGYIGSGFNASFIDTLPETQRKIYEEMRDNWYENRRNAGFSVGEIFGLSSGFTKENSAFKNLDDYTAALSNAFTEVASKNTTAIAEKASAGEDVKSIKEGLSKESVVDIFKSHGMSGTVSSLFAEEFFKNGGVLSNDVLKSMISNGSFNFALAEDIRNFKIPEGEMLSGTQEQLKGIFSTLASGIKDFATESQATSKLMEDRTKLTQELRAAQDKLTEAERTGIKGTDEYAKSIADAQDEVIKLTRRLEDTNAALEKTRAGLAGGVGGNDFDSALAKQAQREKLSGELAGFTKRFKSIVEPFEGMNIGAHGTTLTSTAIKDITAAQQPFAIKEIIADKSYGAFSNYAKKAAQQAFELYQKDPTDVRNAELLFQAKSVLDNALNAYILDAKKNVSDILGGEFTFSGPSKVQQLNIKRDREVADLRTYYDSKNGIASTLLNQMATLGNDEEGRFWAEKYRGDIGTVSNGKIITSSDALDNLYKYINSEEYKNFKKEEIAYVIGNQNDDSSLRRLIKNNVYLGKTASDYANEEDLIKALRENIRSKNDVSDAAVKSLIRYKFGNAYTEGLDYKSKVEALQSQFNGKSFDDIMSYYQNRFNVDVGNTLSMQSNALLGTKYEFDYSSTIEDAYERQKQQIRQMRTDAENDLKNNPEWDDTEKNKNAAIKKGLESGEVRADDYLAKIIRESLATVTDSTIKANLEKSLNTGILNDETKKYLQDTRMQKPSGLTEEQIKENEELKSAFESRSFKSGSRVESLIKQTLASTKDEALKEELQRSLDTGIINEATKRQLAQTGLHTGNFTLRQAYDNNALTAALESREVKASPLAEFIKQAIPTITDATLKEELQRSLDTGKLTDASKKYIEENRFKNPTLTDEQRARREEIIANSDAELRRLESTQGKADFEKQFEENRIKAEQARQLLKDVSYSSLRYGSMFAGENLGKRNRDTFLRAAGFNTAGMVGRNIIQQEYQTVNQALMSERQEFQELNAIAAKRDEKGNPTGEYDYSKLTEEQMKRWNELDGNIRTHQGELEKLTKQYNSFEAVAIGAVAKVGQSFNRFLTRVIRQAFTEAKKFAKEFDESMKTIQAITLKSDKEMESVRKNAISQAKELKTSISTITKIQEQLYRQGLSETEVTSRTEIIAKYAKVTGGDITSSIKSITAAVNTGLVDSVQHAVDVLVALGDTAATTAQEITKGMQRSAASAKAAGVTFEELSVLLALGTEKTQLSGNQISRAYNSLFTRYKKVTSTGLTDSEGGTGSINDVEQALKSAGVEIRDSFNSFRDYTDVLLDLSKVWNNLSEVQQSNIAYTMAGTTQSNVLLSLLEGLADDDGARYEELLTAAKESDGITDEKYEIRVESINTALEELKTAFDSLIEEVNWFTKIIVVAVDVVKDIFNFTSNNEFSSGALLASLALLLVSPLAAAVSAGLALVVSGIVAAIETTTDEYKAKKHNETVAEYVETKEKEYKNTEKYISNVRSRIENEDDNAKLKDVVSESELQYLGNCIEYLNTKFPGLADELDLATISVGKFKEALDNYSDKNAEYLNRVYLRTMRSIDLNEVSMTEYQDSLYTDEPKEQGGFWKWFVGDWIKTDVNEIASYAERNPHSNYVGTTYFTGLKKIFENAADSIVPSLKEYGDSAMSGLIANWWEGTLDFSSFSSLRETWENQLWQYSDDLGDFEDYTSEEIYFMIDFFRELDNIVSNEGTGAALQEMVSNNLYTARSNVESKFGLYSDTLEKLGLSSITDDLVQSFLDTYGYEIATWDEDTLNSYIKAFIDKSIINPMLTGSTSEDIINSYSQRYYSDSTGRTFANATNESEERGAVIRGSLKVEQSNAMNAINSFVGEVSVSKIFGAELEERDAALINLQDAINKDNERLSEEIENEKSLIAGLENEKTIRSEELAKQYNITNLNAYGAAQIAGRLKSVADFEKSKKDFYDTYGVDYSDITEYDLNLELKSLNGKKDSLDAEMSALDKFEQTKNEALNNLNSEISSIDSMRASAKIRYVKAKEGTDYFISNGITKEILEENASILEYEISEIDNILYNSESIISEAKNIAEIERTSKISELEEEKFSKTEELKNLPNTINYSFKNFLLNRYDIDKTFGDGSFEDTRDYVVSRMAAIEEEISAVTIEAENVTNEELESIRSQENELIKELAPMLEDIGYNIRDDETGEISSFRISNVIEELVDKYTDENGLFDSAAAGDKISYIVELGNTYEELMLADENLFYSLNEDLEYRIENLYEEYRQLEQYIEPLDYYYKSNYQRTQLEQDIRNIDKQIETLSSSTYEDMDSYKEAVATISSLEESKAQKESELAVIKTDLTTYEQVFAELELAKAELDRLNSEKLSLETEYANTFSSEYKNGNRTREQIQADLDATNAAIAVVEKEKEDLNTVLEKSSIAAQLTSMYGQFIGMTSEEIYEYFKNQIADIDKQIEEYNKNISELQNRIMSNKNMLHLNPVEGFDATEVTSYEEALLDSLYSENADLYSKRNAYEKESADVILAQEYSDELSNMIYYGYTAAQMSAWIEKVKSSGLKYSEDFISTLESLTSNLVNISTQLDLSNDELGVANGKIYDVRTGKYIDKTVQDYLNKSTGSFSYAEQQQKKNFANYLKQFKNLTEFYEAMNENQELLSKYATYISTETFSNTIAAIEGGAASYADLITAMMEAAESIQESSIYGSEYINNIINSGNNLESARTIASGKFTSQELSNFAKAYGLDDSIFYLSKEQQMEIASYYVESGERTLKTDLNQKATSLIQEIVGLASSKGLTPEDLGWDKNTTIEEMFNDLDKLGVDTSSVRGNYSVLNALGMGDITGIEKQRNSQAYIDEETGEWKLRDYNTSTYYTEDVLDENDEVKYAAGTFWANVQDELSNGYLKYVDKETNSSWYASAWDASGKPTAYTKYENAKVFTTEDMNDYIDSGKAEKELDNEGKETGYVIYDGQKYVAIKNDKNEIIGYASGSETITSEDERFSGMEASMSYKQVGTMFEEGAYNPYKIGDTVYTSSKDKYNALISGSYASNSDYTNKAISSMRTLLSSSASYEQIASKIYSNPYLMTYLESNEELQDIMYQLKIGAIDTSTAFERFEKAIGKTAQAAANFSSSVRSMSKELKNVQWYIDDSWSVEDKESVAKLLGYDSWADAEANGLTIDNAVIALENIQLANSEEIVDKLNDEISSSFVNSTGGVITLSGDYKIEYGDETQIDAYSSIEDFIAAGLSEEDAKKAYELSSQGVVLTLQQQTVYNPVMDDETGKARVDEYGNIVYGNEGTRTVFTSAAATKGVKAKSYRFDNATNISDALSYLLSTNETDRIFGINKTYSAVDDILSSNYDYNTSGKLLTKLGEGTISESELDELASYLGVDKRTIRNNYSYAKERYSYKGKELEASNAEAMSASWDSMSKSLGDANISIAEFGVEEGNAVELAHAIVNYTGELPKGLKESAKQIIRLNDGLDDVRTNSEKIEEALGNATEQLNLEKAQSEINAYVTSTGATVDGINEKLAANDAWTSVITNSSEAIRLMALYKDGIIDANEYMKQLAETTSLIGVSKKQDAETALGSMYSATSFKFSDLNGKVNNDTMMENIQETLRSTMYGTLDEETGIRGTNGLYYKDNATFNEIMNQNPYIEILMKENLSWDEFMEAYVGFMSVESSRAITNSLGYNSGSMFDNFPELIARITTSAFSGNTTDLNDSISEYTDEYSKFKSYAAIVKEAQTRGKENLSDSEKSLLSEAESYFNMAYDDARIDETIVHIGNVFSSFDSSITTSLMAAGYSTEKIADVLRIISEELERKTNENINSTSINNKEYAASNNARQNNIDAWFKAWQQTGYTTMPSLEDYNLGQDDEMTKFVDSYAYMNEGEKLTARKTAYEKTSNSKYIKWEDAASEAEVNEFVKLIREGSLTGDYTAAKEYLKNHPNVSSTASSKYGYSSEFLGLIDENAEQTNAATLSTESIITGNKYSAKTGFENLDYGTRKRFNILDAVNGQIEANAYNDSTITEYKDAMVSMLSEYETISSILTRLNNGDTTVSPEEKAKVEKYFGAKYGTSEFATISAAYAESASEVYDYIKEIFGEEFLSLIRNKVWDAVSDETNSTSTSAKEKYLYSEAVQDKVDSAVKSFTSTGSVAELQTLINNPEVGTKITELLTAYNNGDITKEAFTYQLNSLTRTGQEYGVAKASKSDATDLYNKFKTAKETGNYDDVYKALNENAGLKSAFEYWYGPDLLELLEINADTSNASVLFDKAGTTFKQNEVQNQIDNKEIDKFVGEKLIEYYGFDNLTAEDRKTSVYNFKEGLLDTATTASKKIAEMKDVAVLKGTENYLAALQEKTGMTTTNIAELEEAYFGKNNSNQTAYENELYNISGLWSKLTDAERKEIFGFSDEESFKEKFGDTSANYLSYGKDNEPAPFEYTGEAYNTRLYRDINTYGSKEEFMVGVKSDANYEAYIKSSSELAKIYKDLENGAISWSEAQLRIKEALDKSRKSILDYKKAAAGFTESYGTAKYFANKKSYDRTQDSDDMKYFQNLTGLSFEALKNYSDEELRKWAEDEEKSILEQQNSVLSNVADSFIVSDFMSTIDNNGVMTYKLGDIEIVPGETYDVGIEEAIAEAYARGDEDTAAILEAWRVAGEKSVTRTFVTEGEGENQTGKFVYTINGKSVSGKNYSKSSGGGGKSAADELIDKWKNRIEVNQHRINMLDKEAEGYKNKGELTNYGSVLSYKRDELLALKSEYEQANEELKKLYATTSKGTKNSDSDNALKLRNQIMAYEEAIADVNNQLEENTRLLEENKEAIRQTRITLEETVRTEIENRRQIERDMLGGQVSLENSIIDAIKERYQAEWNLMRENYEKQKEALEQEKSLLQERVDARRNAANEAEKAEELAEYKRQLAIVQMDSTRTKDALELQKKIADLEKEIGQTREDEMLAQQQQAIDDEEAAIDDLISAGESELEVFLSDANNFATELNEILAMSQEDLLDWLRDNVTEFALSTEAAGEQMINSWTDTYEQWKHIINKWNTEIDDILGTKEGFLEYMKQSDEYVLGDDEVKESLLYQWGKAYDEFVSAYKDDNATWGHTDDWLNEKVDSISTDVSKVSESVSKIAEEQSKQNTTTESIDKTSKDSKEQNTSFFGKVYDWFSSVLTNSSRAEKFNSTVGSGKTLGFATGGLVDYTGWAWVDGTPSAPEYVLSANQWDTIASAIKPLTTSYIPSMYKYSSDGSGTTNNNTMNVTINVTGSLNSDADLDSLAERIGDKFTEQLGNRGFNTRWNV